MLACRYASSWKVKQDIAVLARYFGDMLESPMVQMGKEMSLSQISEFVPDLLSPEKLKAISDDLAKA